MFDIIAVRLLRIDAMNFTDTTILVSSEWLWQWQYDHSMVTPVREHG